MQRTHPNEMVDVIVQTDDDRVGQGCEEGRARAQEARTPLRDHQRLRGSRSARRTSRSWRSTRASSSPRTRRSGRRRCSVPAGSDAAPTSIAALDVPSPVSTSSGASAKSATIAIVDSGIDASTRGLRGTRQGAGQLRHARRTRTRPATVAVTARSSRASRRATRRGLCRCCTERRHRLARRHGRPWRRQDERRDRCGRVDLPEQGGVQHPRRQLLAPLGCREPLLARSAERRGRASCGTPASSSWRRRATTAPRTGRAASATPRAATRS